MGTRTHAAVHKWSFTMSRAEFLLQLQTVRLFNAHRDPKKQPKPFTLDWPWPDVDDVDPAERERLTALLESKSAMPEEP